MIVGLDHVQVAMPGGEEVAVRHYYGEVLELQEVDRPRSSADRGGVWFEQDGVKLHLGVDPEFRPAGKAHPAFVVSDLKTLKDRIKDFGFAVLEAESFRGKARFFSHDPFGNRIEFMEK